MERREAMRKPSDAKVTTITVPRDVRMILDSWTAKNYTSMAAEVIRSIRDRAARERLEESAAA
jgi:hypothetical protein